MFSENAIQELQGWVDEYAEDIDDSEPSDAPYDQGRRTGKMCVLTELESKLKYMLEEARNFKEDVETGQLRMRQVQKMSEFDQDYEELLAEDFVELFSEKVAEKLKEERAEE